MSKTKAKSKINSDFKFNPFLNDKINMEIDYFIACLEMEADKVEIE